MSTSVLRDIRTASPAPRPSPSASPSSPSSASSSSATSRPSTPAPAIHLVLWVLQGALALMFAMTGAVKAGQPMTALAAQLHWPGDVPEMLVRFMGVSEVLGALALIVPAATRVVPGLAVLAAGWLAALAALAGFFHVVLGDAAQVPLALVMAALAAFVAWGRVRKAPIGFR